MSCRCVCVKESMYERESVAREKRRSKISWWSARSSLFWVFLVPFAPKVFFLNQSCFFFARRLCLFRKFDVFVRRCTSRRKETWVHQQFLKYSKKGVVWIEKSASNVERSKRNALKSF